jgi:hypothetical protein
MGKKLGDNADASSGWGDVEIIVYPAGTAIPAGAAAPPATAVPAAQ